MRTSPPKPLPESPASAGRGWPARTWTAALTFGAIVFGLASPARAQAPQTPARGATVTPDSAHYPILFIRSQETYDTYRPSEGAGLPYALKRIPLSEEGFAAGAPYLSLGGELRYRADAFDNPLFGLTNGENFTSHQTRFLLHADWRPDPAWRVFVQLGAADETGREPSERVFDESEPDITQAFVDYRFGGGKTPWLVRLGRQELSFGRYITLRDGTNLRRTFDGARLTGPLLGGTLDGFTASVTDQQEGLFDDETDNQDKAWGLSYARPVGDSSRVIATYFNRQNERALYAAGNGAEDRNAYALRLQSRRGAFDFDGQVSIQTGTLATRGGPTLDIDAWGFASETGFSLSGARMSPRFALRLDAASGDEEANDSKLGTFDLAYPDLTYISDAITFAARNLWQVQPFVTINPSEHVSLTGGAGFLWRMEQGDSVYAPPALRLTAIDAPGGAFVSTQAYLRAIWRVNEFVELSSSLVHSDAAGVLKEAGLADQALAAFQISTRF